ncbi:MAG: AAA family ATPase [Ignavibacteriales bacterium]
MTGTFGSGCTRIAREFIEPLGYKYLSLSDLLRQHCREELRIDGALTRTQLQDHGNNLRERLGPGVLAEWAIRIVNQDTAEKWVLDSIRNPEEVVTLRREYAGFFLVGVYADRQVRWERSRERYRNDQNAFDEDEKRDREEDLHHGQRVAECFMNVARLGGGSIALNVARLYTTTYPCNLCANKIAQVRISEVIYFEPYPMEEAQAILSKNNVRQKSFEGITFRCYFRVYGGGRQ